MCVCELIESTFAGGGFSLSGGLLAQRWASRPAAGFSPSGGFSLSGGFSPSGGFSLSGGFSPSGDLVQTG
jgi:hypothetical protein